MVATDYQANPKAFSDNLKKFKPKTYGEESTSTLLSYITKIRNA